MSAEIDAERVLVHLCLSKANWSLVQSVDTADFLDDRSKTLWDKISKWHIDNPGEKMNVSWLRMSGASQEELEWVDVRSEGDDAITLARGIHASAARRYVADSVKRLQANLITPQQFEEEYRAAQPDLSMEEAPDAEFGDTWAREEAKRFREIGRWSTGFRFMDVDFKYVPGSLGILAADTGKGKSYLADDMAFSFAMANNAKWGLIPLEMNRQQRASRWCVGHSDEELATVWCADRPAYSFSSIIRTIEDMSKEGIKFWEIDHFHCISNESKESDTAWQERCAQTLANLALRLGLYILSPAQLSKAGGKKDGGYNKHDIRGAKGISDAASDIFILNRCDDMDYLEADKSRFTPTGYKFPILFRWEQQRAEITDSISATKEKAVQDVRRGITMDGHF